MTQQSGDIIIAPRVLEKIIAIATAKVDGVHSFANKNMSDSLMKNSSSRGVYIEDMQADEKVVDIYLYLEYGVSVPNVAMEIQKTVKTAVRNYVEMELAAVNLHVAGIVPEKTPKPDLKDLFNEDFLND
ncbi:MULTISPECIES: Asp23/Gls24 family envelope stress response protein [unclassified Streptococcus]|uniref:Asp23/Gls24 family envelope stress response protein n=1 Tax=unclassified Streptococcus TaxID=2608887 RepID=UPI0018AAB69C|nr:MULTISPECIES: Asp23/Gls24 family envelope stress response protein [unclassified Streptococcus]MBF8970938.1 Asp23/Gls24 family envelope stress response protein [Streptococcus sp. NLN76]MBG9367215.1 Asp23/Gls24 family envelope stress response protein [Streptococcus sp. NLN64]MBJ6746187.1 Asp23/Gls24 family envelope stress response protein [Streptococcus sp. 121]